MKEVLAVVVLVLALLVAYKVHRDKVEAALAEAAVGRGARVESPLSEVLAPYQKELFGKLNLDAPTDLVPPLEVIKSRVVAKQHGGEPFRQPICAAGLRTLEQMLPAAELRTRTLHQMLSVSSRPPSALDRTDSTVNSNVFFQQSSVKRWEEGRKLAQPAVDRALTQLRAAENEVRQHYGEKAADDDFTPPRLRRVYVAVQEGDVKINPLDRGAYDQRRAFPWREDYYEQYGSPTGGSSSGR